MTTRQRPLVYGTRHGDRSCQVRREPRAAGGDGRAAKLAREDLGRLGTDDEIWQAEIKASAARWSGPRAGAIVGPDAQFDAIMAELPEIKRMLSKLLHG
jgi:hypothetical protein